MPPLDGGHSGKTQRAFCNEHELSLPVFTYCLGSYRRLYREDSGFQEIAPSASAGDGALVEVIYPNGVRLRFFGSVDAGCLERLLQRAG